MEEDISKKTIAVLLMITVVLSAIGTWLMVTSKPESVIYGPQELATPEAAGKVSFTLLDRDAETSAATGLVSYQLT